MKVLIWIVEGTWRSCIDAARTLAPADADLVLLHVIPQEIPAAAHGAYAGLLGRGHPERDPGRRVERITAESAEDILRAAAQRLARPCTQLNRSGHIEHEVVTAAEDAGLLILARDGDSRHRGPKSLGKASRFIVDHAPCPVLLVWPAPPTASAMPPPPPPPHPRLHRPR
jgi:nucleotide-binding universal stress UspA family protein